MPNEQTYQASCHCGRIRAEVITDLAPVIECNCSLCSRRGWLLTFVPAERFKLQTSEEGLTEYQFHRKRVHHMFCPVCGVQVFGRGENKDGALTYAVNVRCLEGVNLKALEITQVDGKSL